MTHRIFSVLSICHALGADVPLMVSGNPWKKFQSTWLVQEQGGLQQAGRGRGAAQSGACCPCIPHSQTEPGSS